MKKKGFTLLETIIYCTLFAVLMSGAIVAVYALIGSSAQTKLDTSIIAEAAFINQKLSWLLSGDFGVTQLSTSSLLVVRPDLGADSPITLSVEDNNFFITRNLKQLQPLTGLPFRITDTVLETSTSTVSISYRINGTMFNYQNYTP